MQSFLGMLSSFHLRSTSIRSTSRVDARADFFSVLIINVWNQLSDEIVNAFSISSPHYKLVKTDFYIAITEKNN